MYTSLQSRTRSVVPFSIVGSADGLASELSGKNWKGMTISVTSVSNNTVDLALGK